MNLKSVSPIVSVVLLIVATIAIGTILMAWGSGLLQEKQSVSEETSKAVFGNENYLSIDNLANSGGNLLIWIRNSGEEDVKVEYFRIYIEKNEIEQNPVDVSGMTVPKKGTVKLADIPLSLEEGDTVFVKITTKSGYVMTKTLDLAPKVTTTLSPPPTTPPPNNPPNADFDYDPPNPYTNDVIQFTDLSIDPDGTIVSWLWDFGDSQTSTDQNPTHSYPENNTYTISLTVTDDDGATDTIQKDVTVLNQNPVADANGPYSGNVGENITFDGSGSYDPDGNIVSWDWDFGDTTTGSGETTAHAYTNPGDYTVTLTVTDDDSGVDTDTTTVHVNYPPAVNVTYPNGGETLNGIENITAVASDSDGTVVLVTFYYSDDGINWNLIDSDTTSPYEVSWDTRRVLNNTTYLIKAIAQDDLGATGEDTSDATFSVSNTSASLNILNITTSPTEVKQGDTGITVTMDVENTGEAFAYITDLYLTFTHTSGDVSSDYTVTPSPSNPTEIEGGTTETFTFTVDVAYNAQTGLITIDGYIEGTDAATNNTISDNTADTPDQWIVEFFDDVENGTNGWSVTSSNPNVLWHITQHRYHSSDHSWYYGRENVWTYRTGNQRNYGTLTSISIDLTSATITSATLRFWAWWQIEHGFGSDWDRMEVYISTNGGASWTRIWRKDSDDPDMNWHEETIDISGYIGNNIVIRFSFDTVDGLYNNYEGWYVDDVYVDVSQ